MLFLPIIPWLCAGFVATGLAGLFWYDSLTAEQKQEADRLAAQYAEQLYQKSVAMLTTDERDTVASFVRRHLKN
jgi:hypothetical protein